MKGFFTMLYITNIITVVINLAITVMFYFKFEKYKSKLLRITEEHKIKYSNYYSEKVRILNEIFSQICVVEKSLNSLIQFINYSNYENSNSVSKEPTEVMNNLKTYIDKNRIYLNENICYKLDNLTEKIRETLGNFSTFAGLNTNLENRQLSTDKKIYF